MEAPIRQTGRWTKIEDPDAPFGETLLSTTWGSEVRIEFTGTDLRIQAGELETLGGHLYVTLNGEPAQSELFELDELGRTYLDLDSIDRDRQVLTLVEGYQTDRPRQTNVFVMHIHEDARFSISTIDVEFRRTYGRFGTLALLSFAGIGGSLAIIRRRPTR
jgi:hypothetical protein